MLRFIVKRPSQSDDAEADRRAINDFAAATLPESYSEWMANRENPSYSEQKHSGCPEGFGQFFYDTFYERWRQVERDMAAIYRLLGVA